MKRALSVILVLSLVLTVMAFPVSASAADTTASASTEAPAAPTAKPAASTGNGTVNTANLAPGSVYTVVSGDVFWRIAKQFSLTMDELAKLNPQVKDINKIYVGDKLIVKAAAAATTPVATATKLYHGFGEAANYRFLHDGILNITTASAVFDQDGKIQSLKWDVEEITPEIFPGWASPEDPAYKDNKAAQAEFKSKIDDQWKTKIEEKDEYGMKASANSKKEWWEQIKYYENFFKGKTVDEVVAWVNKYTDVNKRPYKFAYPAKMTDADKAATANFTAEEKQMLVDVTTNATMSLQDDHSHFITALKEAYAIKEEIK